MCLKNLYLRVIRHLYILRLFNLWHMHRINHNILMSWYSFPIRVKSFHTICLNLIIFNNFLLYGLIRCTNTISWIKYWTFRTWILIYRYNLIKLMYMLIFLFLIFTSIISFTIYIILFLFFLFLWKFRTLWFLWLLLWMISYWWIVYYRSSCTN